VITRRKLNRGLSASDFDVIVSVKFSVVLVAIALCDGEERRDLKYSCVLSARKIDTIRCARS